MSESKKESKKDKKVNVRKILALTGNKKNLPVAVAEQSQVDPELQAGIVHAARNYLRDEELKSAKILGNDLKNLESISSEYLKSFIVLGYDFSGNKIAIAHAGNAQEYDSLIEHARGSLMTLIMKAQQQLPNFPDPQPPPF